MDKLADDVIHQLRSQTAPATLAQLAATLSVGRDRLSSVLDDLKSLGYRFQTDAHEHLELVQSPDRMIDVEIWAGLKTRTFARQLQCYQRLGSTNATAIEFAEADAPEGTVVVAEEQLRGRGRLGRNWHSAPGLGIWSSVVLRPRVTPDAITGLSLVAGLAFAETVAHELGLEAQLKWPNDGLLDGRKVCGILVELSAEIGRVRYAVCGTGINVAHQPDDFPPELRATAGSLAMAAGVPVDRLSFYRTFLLQLETLYHRFQRDGLEPLLPGYRRHSLLLGKDVTVRRGDHVISGTAEGIDELGRLVVRQGNETIAISSGEATLR